MQRRKSITSSGMSQTRAPAPIQPAIRIVFGEDEMMARQAELLERIEPLRIQSPLRGARWG